MLRLVCSLSGLCQSVKKRPAPPPKCFDVGGVGAVVAARARCDQNPQLFGPAVQILIGGIAPLCGSVPASIM